MITVILVVMNQYNDELARVALADEKYLEQRGPQFTVLSELSQFSPAFFNAADMPQLKSELELVKEKVSDPGVLKDLQAVIALATRCESEPNTGILFTPFDAPVRRTR